MAICDNKKIDHKVTVVIPCYNRQEFVKETIESALAQTYGNIEVIAVDDGSTDGTRQVLDSYNGRIRVLEHPGRVNKGQSAAINLAMRSSESEYVAILDSDDLWRESKIERQVNFLENNTDIGLVYSNGHAIDQHGEYLYKLFPPDHMEMNSPGRLLLDCYVSVPSNSLVRRSIFKKAGEFDEEMRAAQDHDMILRLAEITKFAFLDEDLWSYRRHANSISSNDAIRRWELGFKILEKACERYDYGPKIRRERLAVLNFRLGQCMLQEHRPAAAALRFLKAGMLDPLRAAMVLLGIERKY